MHYTELTTTESQNLNEYILGMQTKESQPNSRNNNRNDNGRFIERELYGKLAEIAAARLVQGQVDFSIHTDYKHTPDITNHFLANYNIHVKATKNNILEDSLGWIASPFDPIVANPTHNDILLLYVFDNTQVFLKKSILSIDIQGMWKPCTYLQHKHAIHYKNIKHIEDIF